MIAWIGISISILALIASGASVIYSRSSANAATRSADSAALSADAAVRSAAVAERDEQRRLEQEERFAVRWRLEPELLQQTAEGYAFRLTNDGTQPALDVFLTLPRETQQRGDVPEGRMIKDGGFITFEAFPPAQDMSKTEVVIRWRVRPDGDEYTQRWAWAGLL
jgi:hypothetical protein